MQLGNERQIFSLLCNRDENVLKRARKSISKHAPFWSVISPIAGSKLRKAIAE